MKRFFVFLFAVFVCTDLIAYTINWYIGNDVYHTTTCEGGEDITPPTAPEKYGYTFKGWKDVSPVEYIANTGTQYINTGIKPNDTLVINVTLMFKSYCSIFGARTSETHSLFAGYDANAGLFLDYGSGYQLGRIAYFGNIDFGTVYRLSYGNKYIKNLDTSDFFVSDARVTFSPINLNLYLFSLNSNGSAGGTEKGTEILRIYDVQIYDHNVLVRNFMPVVDKNGVACMFDTVENRLYYNVGKGNFVAGPIIGE